MNFKGYIAFVVIMIILWGVFDQFVDKPYKKYKHELEKVHRSRHVHLRWTDEDNYHHKGYYLYFYNNSKDEYDSTGDVYLDETKIDVYNDFKRIESVMNRASSGSIDIEETFYDLVRWNDTKVYFYERYDDEELSFIGWMDKTEFYKMLDNIACYDSGKRNNITIIWLSVVCGVLALIILCIIIHKIRGHSNNEYKRSGSCSSGYCIDGEEGDSGC